MLVASWNVNSIGARLEHLRLFCERKRPDIILLQELKCIEEKFPFEEVEDLGFSVKVFGQKSYNGVAILSKYPIEDVQLGLSTLPAIWPQEARYIEGLVCASGFSVRVASVYVPNGADVSSDKFLYKLAFLQALREQMANLNSEYDDIIIGGDINVAPEEIDVYAPAALEGKIGFHIEERQRFREILNQGFFDSFRILDNARQDFTWWDYRGSGFAQGKGMRIDHILLSPRMTDALVSAEVYQEARGWQRASDHAPYLCKFE